MFVDETGEQLDELIDVLLVLEREPDSTEELNEAFRIIHSIKGSAGMMGFDSIVLLTHNLESYFETLRLGLARLDTQRMNLVLRCTDFLRECILRLGAGEPLEGAGDLLVEVAALGEDQGDAPVSPDHPRVVEAPTTATDSPPSRPPDEASPGIVDVPPLDAGAAPGGYLLTAHFEADLSLPDLKARLIIARLSRLGTVVLTRPTEDELETIERFSRLDVLFRSDQPPDAIRSAVDIDGVTSLELADRATQVPTREAATVVEREENKPEEAPARGVEVDDSVQAGRADETPRTEMPSDSAAGVTSEVTTETRLRSEDERARPLQPVIDAIADVPPNAVATSATQTTRGGSRRKSSETMRVDVDRLDNLLNLTGELVIGRARLAQVAAVVASDLQKRSALNEARDLMHGLGHTLEHIEPLSDNKDLKQGVEEARAAASLITEQDELWTDVRRGFAQITEAIDQLTRISNSLQHSVLATRMVPVAPLFNRFKRVVRDLSDECGKKVDLDLRGEKTELDKRMIDELGDPLVHLIRNSIDHGLEYPEVRRQRGKPERGTIFLEASHSGNDVFLSIRDDGGGIDISRIRQRLDERGILDRATHEELTDHELMDYIWHPGFSTSSEVTDISGRGVGMDAVRTRIGDLNGSIDVDSVAGEGTTFTIRLPLTLAIINCLLIRVRDVIFSLPVENIREIVKVPMQSVVTVHNQHTIDVRSEFITLVSIEDVFDWHAYQEAVDVALPQDSSNGSATLNAMILRLGDRVLALRVDELLGSEDMVIKSLSENFVPIRGISGASILGDGTVSLMLDIASMIELAHEPKVKPSVAGQGD